MDDSYLMEGVTDDSKKLMKNLAAIGDTLKKLKIQMEETALAAEQAKKKYEHYASVVIPSEMVNMGVSSIDLVDGGKITLKHNFYCQPNKNAEDKKKIVEWLRAHGGEHLIKHDATVTVDDAEKAGIPYIENTAVNTASLKSFIKDGIGVTSGVQRFTIEDIPACIHFQEVTTAEVEM